MGLTRRHHQLKADRQRLSCDPEELPTHGCRKTRGKAREEEILEEKEEYERKNEHENKT